MKMIEWGRFRNAGFQIAVRHVLYPAARRGRPVARVKRVAEARATPGADAFALSSDVTGDNSFGMGTTRISWNLLPQESL